MGADFVDVPDVAAFKAEGFKGAETWLCTGKIKRVRPCYVGAFEFLAKNVPADEVKYIKMTMVRPHTSQSPLPPIFSSSLPYKILTVRLPPNGSTSATATTPSPKKPTLPKKATSLTSPKPTAKKSPTSTKPAAETSKSTTPSSPIFVQQACSRE